MNKYLLITLLTLPLVGFSGTERLNYQGKLVHGNSPVTGSVPMTFQIYDGQAGTNVLYEESMDVDVVDGYYSIELGEYPNYGQLVSAIKREDAHIQVTISGKKLKPREKVGRPPFAEKSTEIWNEFCTYPMRENAYVDADINNTNHWLRTHPGATKALEGSLHLYEGHRTHWLFPPAISKKHVMRIKILAQIVKDTSDVNQYAQGGVVQAVVRSLHDDQIVRTLTDQINVGSMSSGTWFECPLNKPYSESMVDIDEYLSLEFSLIDDGDGINEWGFSWLSVFTTIVVQ